MTQNDAKFMEGAGRTKAAQLVADDELTNAEIAEACGISPRTLDRWKAHPQFQAAVKAYHDAFERKVMAEGIARRANRVAALNERWQLLKQVITARAEVYGGDNTDDDGDPLELVAPGASTGLLVQQVRSVGFGENNMIIKEWVVDTGILAELRAIEKQAAQEVGQWLDRSETKLTLDVEDELQTIANEMGVSVDEARAVFEEVMGGKA